MNAQKLLHTIWTEEFGILWPGDLNSLNTLAPETKLVVRYTWGRRGITVAEAVRINVHDDKELRDVNLLPGDKPDGTMPAYGDNIHQKTQDGDMVRCSCGMSWQGVV